MPDNLNAGILARILALAQPEVFDGTGRSYIPEVSWAMSGGGAEGGDAIPTVTGVRGYDWAPGMYSDNKELNGKPYDTYDLGGNHTGTGTFSISDLNWKKGLAAVALAALGGAAASGAFGGAAAAGGAGAAEGAAGAAGSGVGGSAGATTFGVLDPSITWGMNGADLLAGSSGFTPFSFGVTDPTIPWGTDVSQFSFPSAAGGIASTLAKYGLPLAGALAGAKGIESEQTTEKNLPDWLAPYLTGNDGLFAAVQKRLQEQLAPGALDGYTDMQALGRQLMARPVAGNGYSQFFGGR